MARPRMATHFGVLAGAAVIILSAQFNSLSSRTEVLSQFNRNTGYGSVLDETAAAEVAARVASTANLLVTDEATQKASRLTAQVALAGTEEALAKRQVVSTAQSVRRDIGSYTVKSGDTISNIAREFNVTSETIKWANGIEDISALKVGQTLRIMPVTGVLHKIAGGDTAASIAARYQAVEAQIIEFNDLDIRGLEVGREIIVPEGIIQEAPKPKPTVVAVASAPSSPRAFNFSSGNGYPWGQCTYHIAEVRSIPGNLGNAWQWAYSGYFSRSSTPTPGSIAWTPYGWGGYGHVAYVASVDHANRTVTVSERNYNGNPYISYRTVSWGTFQGYLQ